MRKYNKYEPVFIEQTPIIMPLIKVDFFERTGVKIQLNNKSTELDKYICTIDFYSQKEYDDFMKSQSGKES